MNAIQLIGNRSNIPNKISQRAGLGCKKSFNDGPVAFELASKTMQTFRACSLVVSYSSLAASYVQNRALCSNCPANV